MPLIRPDRSHLPSYVDALRQGWSPNNLRPEAGAEELLAIQADPDAFLAGLDDPEGRGPPVAMPDGSTVPRLPGIRRWMWDGEFCGSIGLRWQPGTAELPPYCLGHIGYAVVPWKRRQGHATAALASMLAHARTLGLPWVIVTTQPDNVASQRVILANGGLLVERFQKLAAYGGGEEWRYRIELASVTPAAPGA